MIDFGHPIADVLDWLGKADENSMGLARVSWRFVFMPDKGIANQRCRGPIRPHALAARITGDAERVCDRSRGGAVIYDERCEVGHFMAPEKLK